MLNDSVGTDGGDENEDHDHRGDPHRLRVPGESLRDRLVLMLLPGGDDAEDQHGDGRSHVGLEHADG